MLFGEKTIAIFDIWTLEHFIAGMGIFVLAKWIAHRFGEVTPTENFKPYIAYVLAIAYIWEAIEFYLEAGYTGNEQITFWFQGVEFWANRVIADPIVTTLGAYVASRLPVLFWPARVASIVWLLVHIYVFPHSMYLHTVLGV